MQEAEVLGLRIIDGARSVLGGLPEALANIVDADPHGDEKVVGGPWDVGRGRHKGVLELGDLGDDIGRDTGVDDGVRDVCAVVCPVVGQDERGVVLFGDHAYPVQAAGRGRATCS